MEEEQQIKEDMQKAKDKKVEAAARDDSFRIDNYLHNVATLWTAQPFFYDRSGIFWLWDNEKCYWYITEETDIMNIIEKKLQIYGRTVKSYHKQNFLEAFKRHGRKKIPEEAPKSWVQFHDIILDIKTKKKIRATPYTFVCNPIPHEIGVSSETPTMDKLFKEWVGEKYVQTLYEILAYCCLPNYPLHTIFCFMGSGRNGKSKFQQLLARFIGW